MVTTRTVRGARRSPASTRAIVLLITVASAAASGAPCLRAREVCA